MQMPQKRSSLTAALADHPPAQEPSPRAPTTPTHETAEHKPRRAPARERKVNVAAWFPPAVKYGLQELALERTRSVGQKVTLQDLMAEAFNDLFKKYGKAELAPDREG